MKSFEYKQTEQFLKNVPLLKKRVEMLAQKIECLQEIGSNEFVVSYIFEIGKYTNPAINMLAARDKERIIKKEYIQKKMLLDDLEQAMLCLTKQESVSIDLFYFKGMTLKEMKEITSYSIEHISRIKKSAVNKLTQLLIGISVSEIPYQS